MKRTRVAVGSTVFGVSMLAVSIGNYGLNILLARWLPAEAFGDAALMVSVMLLTTVVASTVQLSTSAKILQEPENAEHIEEAVRSEMAGIGIVTAFGLAAFAFPLSAWLQLSDARMLLVMAAGIPIHLRLAVERGILHGRLRFGALTSTYGAELIVRTLASIGVVALGHGALGVTIALNLGFVAALIPTGRLKKSRLTRPRTTGSVLAAGAGPMGTLVLATTIATNADVVLAKAVLVPFEAGHFAVLSLVGRSIFFAAWTLLHAAVPVIAGSAFDRERAGRLLVVGTAVLSMSLAGVAWLLDEVLISVAFGPEHAPAAAFVGPYAFGTAIFSVMTAAALVDAVANRGSSSRMLLGVAFALLVVAAWHPSSLASLVDVRTTVFALGVVTAGLLKLQRVLKRPLIQVETSTKVVVQ